MSPTPWDLPPRIAAKIAVDAETGCWLWGGTRTLSGYPRVSIDGKARRAHRAVYEMIAYGIPEGMEMDHICRVRRCVNPLHVEPVDAAENKRRASDATQSLPLFKCGHRRAGNTHHFKRPDRQTPASVCRECHRTRGLDYYHRNLSAATQAA